MTNSLPTRNPEWGFWGTVERTGLSAKWLWELASANIAEATGAGPEGVRDFLDSQHGRHFADAVWSEVGASAGQDDTERAVAHVVQVWQGWRVGRRASREHGIPADLPYLTGWVSLFDQAA
jgi:hypothetical protein